MSTPGSVANTVTSVAATGKHVGCFASELPARRSLAGQLTRRYVVQRKVISSSTVVYSRGQNWQAEASFSGPAASGCSGYECAALL